MPAGRTRAVVWLSAAALAAAIAIGVWRIPVQAHDAIDEIVAGHQSPGVWASFTSTIGSTSYFRPLRFAESKALMDLSGGRYQLAFKAFHLAFVVAAFALFVDALAVQTAVDAVAALFALTVFVGLHTFAGFVREGFPINHFVQMAVYVLAAIRLSRSRPRVAVDVAALGVLTVAVLTLESGVLVWVALAVGRLVGRRGVSDRALAGATALLGVYLVVRFGLLASNLQGMSNDSGYFFERLGPAEIRARFGTGWSRYNVYSMVSALGSVLFSEPRGGVLLFGRSLLEGDVPPRRWITVLVSSGTTLLIAAWAWRRLRERRMDEDLRDLAVGAAVLIASAVASFAYAKDEVMGVAGACYAVVAFWAVRDTLATRWRPAARVCVMLGLVVAGTGWAVRTVGLTVALRARAFDVRNEWAVTREEMQARGAWPSDASTQRVVEQLRREALDHPSSSPWFLPRWTDRIFDSDYF